MICKQEGCQSEVPKREGRGRPPSYCAEHGTNRACLERRRRAAGVKVRLKLESPQDREARAFDREKRAARDAVKAYYRAVDRGELPASMRVVHSPDTMVVGQWVTELSTFDKAPLKVIGQTDLRADWHEDGYVDDPGKYKPDAKPMIGLVPRGPDWPW